MNTNNERIEQTTEDLYPQPNTGSLKIKGLDFSFYINIA